MSTTVVILLALILVAIISPVLVRGAAAFVGIVAMIAILGFLAIVFMLALRGAL
jgi:hypothetical protein